MNGAEQALATLREYIKCSTGPALGLTQGDALRALAALDELMRDEGRCPTCGEDGGTSCGMPNCGLLA